MCGHIKFLINVKKHMAYFNSTFTKMGPLGLLVSTQTFFFLIQENSNLYKPRGHGSGGGLETSQDEESIT